ncbi:MULTISPECIES: rod shape-determining protein MreC [unclassified Snodgrassella]|uniref:rod shape-determining protein MreC n=1 Tax=unclassified Snodgrassella TaxID=2625236 RepID=UPI001583FA85|nr:MULTISPECIES: rod shape-determining protein MreC [Snodgrassella]MBI0067323.1 rod shape-determining protein MreC [Snodgrassella sp. M0110]MBI0076712.1 rod shape-determining protein MreC [Snodgrassella sp. M0118]MBI0078624.1 rod shape-determining protein MreC [Snodgrassella sp. M0112]NUF78401.1 rod shape-determining protein MreC [Snodgrassella sp. ESL0323]
MAEPSLNFVHNGLRSTSKLIVLSLFAVALLLLDNRYDVVKISRNYIGTALYPLQWLAMQPVNAVSNGMVFFEKQQNLNDENKLLKAQNAQLKLQLSQRDAQLKSVISLDHLTQLQKAALPQAQVAQIVSSDTNPLTDRFIIDKGSNHQIRQGDAVSDEHGLIGQITAVQPLSSEVTLITNSNAVIPAMVMRTGVRTLVYGRSGSLDLRYFPANASLLRNDLLVTSGMDSIYPAGIPIATVMQAQGSNGSPYYRVQIEPVAQLRNSNFVLVIPQKHAQTAHYSADVAATNHPLSTSTNHD